LSVSNRLKEKSRLDTVGGNSYLTELINEVPSPGHAISYANIIRHKRILRDLIAAAHDIEMLGYAESEDIDTVVDEAEKKSSASRKKALHKTFM